MTNIETEHWHQIQNDNGQGQENINDTIINQTITRIRNNSDLRKFNNEHPQANVYDMLTNKPNRREISNAIRTLKNNKAHGIDGIIGEAYKATHNWIVDKLLDLYTDMHNNNKMLPEDWTE